ncbi:hypothetical protein [Streptomyces aureocirculatus]|uniref:hypothetical protein n=1 Tax=Streptomyces aureocirculatus TaxID=67275 RepID=UPI0004CA31BF|nr:hypothetical protein [Streptomyces aureocirculatus]
MNASANSRLTLDDVLDLSTALDLVDAKIELLSEYKLEYPQDYAPDGIRFINDEVEQLHQLRTRLMDLQAAGKQSPPPEKTTMPSPPRGDQGIESGSVCDSAALPGRHTGGMGSETHA